MNLPHSDVRQAGNNLGAPDDDDDPAGYGGGRQAVSYDDLDEGDVPISSAPTYSKT